MHKIVSTSISDAYIKMLHNTLTSPFPCVMQVTMVTNPVLENGLNDDEKVRAAYEAYTFPKNAKGEARTGKYWIDNRKYALLNEMGEYRKRMKSEGQLDYVISALKGWNALPKTKEKFYSWHANRIMINLFNPSRDLHQPRAPIPPCLTSINFCPSRKSLSLIGTFRAQYSDIKAYGNLLSLAQLLKDISEETSFTPAIIHSVAQRATLVNARWVGQELLNKLVAVRG